MTSTHQRPDLSSPGPAPLNEPSVAGAAAVDPHTYSVCMLCSNDGRTVEASVQSVLALSKTRRLEVVVVDNLSADGSASSLRRLRDEGQIILIEKRCTRGEGRQLAFGAS